MLPVLSSAKPLEPLVLSPFKVIEPGVLKIDAKSTSKVAPLKRVNCTVVDLPPAVAGAFTVAPVT